MLTCRIDLHGLQALYPGVYPCDMFLHDLKPTQGDSLLLLQRQLIVLKARPFPVCVSCLSGLCLRHLSRVAKDMFGSIGLEKTTS